MLIGYRLKTVYRFTFRESLEPVTGLKPVQIGMAQPQGASYHTAQAGETFWHIAARYDMSYEQLMALNPQVRNPNLILAGEQVRVA